MNVTVSAVREDATLQFSANGSWNDSSSRGLSYTDKPLLDFQGIPEGRDFAITEKKTNSVVAAANLKFSSASAEVKTELPASPDVELVLDTKGGVPLVIKDKEGAIQKVPMKVPAGKAVFTISPANP